TPDHRTRPLQPRTKPHLRTRRKQPNRSRTTRCRIRSTDQNGTTMRPTALPNRPATRTPPTAYVPAFRDRDGLVHRPVRIYDECDQNAVVRSRLMLATDEMKGMRLVQITEADTGESVF